MKEFQRKTVFLLTLIFWGTLFGILLAVNISNSYSNWLETGRLLSTQVNIVKGSDETKNAVAPIDIEKKIAKIFSVALDGEGNYSVAFLTQNSGYEKDALIQIAKNIIAQQKDSGLMEHFRYCVGTLGSGKLISFVDYSIWEQQQARMLTYSILIGVSGMLLLFLIALRLALWLVKPVNSAFEKQKQFISDAGHELKTPLSVMKASLDMLEKECGANKYFGYMKEENRRMTELVYDLLYLSKLDSQGQDSSLENIDLSRLIRGTCLPFEAVAYENEIRLELKIQEELHIRGNDRLLRQFIEILLDNALKHTEPLGMVQVILTAEKGRALLCVRNEGEPIPEEEQSKIFDRFYRSDKARNRTSGRFGLGLSIADSIAKLHRTKIMVECRDHWTSFSVKYNLL